MNRYREQEQQDRQTQEALKKVRALSQIAAKDAGYVTQSFHNSNQPGIHLSQNLYVIRTIEEEIHHRLNTSPQEELSLLMITGEAGFGKTSLLWHLFHTLSEHDQGEPWFIKSTLLTPRDPDSEGQGTYEKDSRITVSHLLAAADALQQQGKHPIILLDTIDLLLHNERNRTHLLEVIDNLRSWGCRIIATSRPQEAIHVTHHSNHQIGLQEYDPRELQTAVSNHVHCFYEYADAREIQEHLERILNAVSNGLQIREVCTNPLTLRMLFTLYAPQEVPLEINTFQLYQTFWDLRVATDHRAGSSYSSGLDLGQSAAMVALSMLVEGTPELTNRLLERRFREWQGNHQHVKILTSRGILHCSEDGTTRFFHQTFFEHCSARGLLFKFRNEAVLLLHTRLKSNPNDLFVSPVMEQTLLLAQDESLQLRSYADNTLLEMLKSDHQLLKTSGIYVYIHRRKVTVTLEHEVDNLLREGKHAILNRFLNLAPNMPQGRHRYKTLFKEMNIAWKSNTAEAQKLVLELLERLASRFPDYVDDFLTAHRILDFEPEIWPLGFRKILNIQVILIKHFPPPRQRESVQRLLTVLARKGTQLLKNRIMDALLHITIILRSTTIADQCEAALKTSGVKTNKLNKIPLAKMFYYGYQFAETSIETILSGLDTGSRFFFNTRLNALSERLINAGKQEISLAWTHFYNEHDEYKQWMWAQIVIPKLIAGYSGEPFEKSPITEASVETNEAVLFSRKEVKTIFSSCSSDPGKASPHFEKIRRALIFANPGKALFLDILNSAGLNNPGPWLTPDLFGELLADAYNIGHPGAVAAMKLLESTPRNYSEKLIAIVRELLQKLDIHDPSVIETAISFYLKTGDAGLLHLFIEHNHHTFLEILPRWRDKIHRFIHQQVTSASEKKRRKGLACWAYLITLPQYGIPPFKSVITLMEKETVNSVSGHIMELMSRCRIESTSDLNTLLALLRPFSVGKDENLHEKSIVAMITAVFTSAATPSEYALQLSDTIFTPPVKEYLVSEFIRRVSEIFPTQNKLNIGILKRMITVCNKQLNHNAHQKLFNDLIKPVRIIVRFSPVSAVEQLMRLVPEVEQYLGRLIVEAACYEHFLSIIPQLDHLMMHADVPARVKEAIRRHKYFRQRTLGGEGWPELEKRLFPEVCDVPLTPSPQPLEDTPDKQKNILFLAANYPGLAQLDIDKEYSAIQNTLRGTMYRDSLNLTSKLAVNYIKFRQGLMELKPQVVHISCHGAPKGLWVLDEDEIMPEVMTNDVISELFKVLADKIRCVVINACHSQSLARLLIEHIPCVIGMESDIEDNPAIQFSSTFYEAIGSGRSIEDAFHLARQAVKQAFPDLAQHAIPALHKRPGTPAQTFIICSSQSTTTELYAKENAQTEQAAKIDLSRLPAHTVPQFVGRDNDILRLEQFLEAPNPHIVSLVGFGGVGKSALIAAFLDRIAPRFGQARQVFGWSFYSQGSHETSATAHLFFEAAINYFDPEGVVPREDSWRVRRLLELLRKHRTLLILDGLEPLQKPSNVDGGRIRDRAVLWLLSDIARVGINGLVLVSTRQPLVELRRFSSSHKEITVTDLAHRSGASLLQILGVRGKEEQRIEASRAFGGNALALVLLGNLLKSRYKGRVGHWKTLPAAALDREQGSHARRILTYYHDLWPQDSPERALLRAMSLVDRPLSYNELAALQKHASFAAVIPITKSPGFNHLLQNLRDAGIITRHETLVECHPVIRTYFSLNFERDAYHQYKEAHGVLFDYFSKLPSLQFPDTIGEMEPLYRAIRHACLAGESQQACQLYFERIQRGNSSFSLYQLGAFDTDLSALANFFPDTWAGEPIAGISRQQANDILTTTSFCLLSLARMEEAIDVLYLNLDWAISNNELLLASSLYENLVEALTQCGRLREAQELADQAVQVLSGFTVSALVNARADTAYVTLYCGEIDSALKKFLRIETELPRSQRPLPGYAGYQFCEALLAKGSKNGFTNVLQRVDKGIEIARTDNRPLHLALFYFARGRALLHLGQRDEGYNALSHAETHAREAGSEETLAFVLTGAGTALLSEACTRADCERAKLWFDEATLIADNRNMTLTKIDLKFGFAKIALKAGDYNSAQSLLKEADTMIEQTGYYLARNLNRSLLEKTAHLLPDS